jgi:hypothetical protein
VKHSKTKGETDMNNHRSKRFIHLFTLLMLLLSLLGSAIFVTPAYAAATITVQSSADDGTAVPANCPGAGCRLRDAIAASAAGDTINFSSDLTITLVSQIYFEKSLTISAVGHNVTISGGNTTRIFEISGDGNTIVFNHLTLANGNGVDRGAAIYLHYRYGYNNLTIIDSTIHDNHSGDYGGGAINVSYDTLKVYNSTFYNNSSDTAAGAIDGTYSNTTIENSTFYNNHTPYYAGAVSQWGGSINLTNNTFVGNGAPRGANVDFGINWGTVVTTNNNIFGTGTSGASCACDNGWATCSLGGTGNFATDNSCGGATTVMSSSLAVFGPLASYGGSTQTLPLLPGNPAINGGTAATCAGLLYGNYDQRGVARFGNCDAGSFESQGFTLTRVGGDNQSTVTGTSFALPLTASVAALNAVEPVAGGKVTFTSPSSGAGTNPITNTATIASGGGVSQNLTANSVVGPYTVTASANGGNINYSLRNTGLPVITWANPANIVYGTALSGTQLNATANVPGAFTYTPAAGTVLNAGNRTLHVDFVPTDITNYSNASKDVSITVTQAMPVITWSNPANIVYGTALSGTQLNATANVPGAFTYAPASGTILSAGLRTLHVDFVPTDTTNYSNASKDVSITVTQAMPVITWSNPANIVYGTALSGTQLNATANVPGAFTYTPAAGTVLNAGNRTLHVDFVPTDTTNYANASKDVSITVMQAAPVITWSNPANIVYGTALSGTQLNATANVPGAFTYTPAAGTVLNAGNRTLHVDFVPTDTINYSNTSKDVSITVTQAASIITWADPTDIVYGTALSETQLNATANVPGAFTYTPALGEILTVGAHSLHVDFVPTDTANYSNTSKDVSITVTIATPVITWSNPANIVYSTPLGGAQLSATANTPGAFTYTPASGEILSVGTHSLHVDFVPTDTANYSNASKDVSITVTSATPVITWTDPANIVYGTALDGTQLNATADVPGAFTYTPASGAVLTVGTHSLHVDFIPTDTANYSNTSRDVSISVTSAAPVITWANPANIVYGAALDGTQLNATADVPGAFTYTPASGAVLTVGTHTLHVDFIPTDTANYSNTSRDVSISVTSAAPVITWANPANIVYGAALDGTQLNATADVPGAFTYTPASGAVLTVGTHTLHVDFVPTDTANYSNTSKDVSITVTQAAPVITWANPADIVYGVPLGVAQLNATADVPGAFTYTPASGAVLAVGTHTLHVDFVPTDTANYANAARDVSLTVLDVTAPTVLSVTRVDPNPTDLFSVDFTVTFSEPVSGVDTTGPDFDDFALDTFGLTDPLITAVASVSGTEYTVTVDTGSGNGTLQLDVLAAGVIVDASNNPLEVGFTAGETYQVLKSAIFADVPNEYWANDFIERLYLSRITGGCGVTPLIYCPNQGVTRAQLAVFLLRSMYGAPYLPPEVGDTTGFNDVPTDHWAAAWIKQLNADGITGGCGDGNFCPNQVVNRAQLAVMLLRAEHGNDYTPPAASGLFNDVPADHWAAPWIEQLVAEGLTGGCGNNNFCPNQPVTRAQMAVFLVAAFNLP